MTLRTNGFCFLRFVLLARSATRLSGFIGDRALSYFPTASAAGAFAIGWLERRSRVDGALCWDHPG